MNRLSGWWRLWIVASAFWAGLNIIAIVYNWPPEGWKYPLSKAELGTMSAEARRVLWSVPPGKNKDGFDYSWPYSQKEATMPGGQTLKIHYGWEDFPDQIAILKQGYSTVQADIHAKACSHLLAKHFWYVMLPVGLSLALGLGSQWVRQGFTDESSPKGLA